MPVKVVLGLEALTPPRTGIGRYTAALLREYLAMPQRVQVLGMRHGVLVDSPKALACLVEQEAVISDWRGPAWKRALSYLPGIRTSYQFVRTLWGSSKIHRLPHKTVYHEPNYIPPSLDCPLVITVHDLSHLVFPQYHPKERVRWLERQLPKALEQAAKVITVSEFSRREILNRLGLAAHKVVTIPLGLEASFRLLPPEVLTSVLARHSLAQQGYVLAVGTLEPRKNLARLLEAYALLPKAVRRRVPLVLVGAKGWHTTPLWSKLDPLARRSELRWLGYVHDAELPALYAGAAVFAYVSLYEGFGLPVLEAMGCGAPVVTSQGSAMASWAGEAAVLADPEDALSIREALLCLLEDVELAQRLRARGQALARRFSWPSCAEATLAVYTEVANG
ncbi:MAG: glycosyltransferase family 4 protein [Methylohalobius sp.]|nr:glycosyltransferase family 4 protein [Methylohalobius sp.]